ncbi:MAG: SDR family oxidoreductase [bacterium]
MKGEKVVVLITGASSGIGKACAEKLAEKGYYVIGTSRLEEKQVLNVGLGQLEIIQMDVDKVLSVKNAVNLVLEKAGKIDVVINNAGIVLAGSIEDTSSNEAKKQLETNFFGVHRVCREVIPIMRAQKKGLIINISSLAGAIGLPFQGFYSASKFALEALSEALKLEVMLFGIKVVLIEPGDFQTPVTQHRRFAKKSLHHGSIYEGNFKKAIEIQENEERNGGNPQKIANLIVKILSKKNPRFRYKIGPSSFLVGMKKFLPQNFIDFLLCQHYKI